MNRRPLLYNELGEVTELSAPRGFELLHQECPQIIGTALAIGLGVAASVGGSVAGGILAKKGAEKQAKAAEQSSAQAIAEQRRQFEITQAQQQPWLTAGTQAIQMLQYLLGLGVNPSQAAQVTSQVTGVPQQQLNQNLERLREMGGREFVSDGRVDGRGREFAMDGDGFDRGGFEPSEIGAGGPAGTTPGGLPGGQFGSLMRDFGAGDFEADPGYAFRLQEGVKALERSAAARGTVLSGGTLKELARYNQDFASKEYQNVFGRFQENRRTRFNQLASVAGAGQMTATELGRQGADTATNIGNLIVGGQTAAAAARASGYSALGNVFGNLGNLPLTWMQLSRRGAGREDNSGRWD
jgi:hypothetical protein